MVYIWCMYGMYMVYIWFAIYHQYTPNVRIYHTYGSVMGTHSSSGAMLCSSKKTPVTSFELGQRTPWPKHVKTTSCYAAMSNLSHLSHLSCWFISYLYHSYIPNYPISINSIVGLYHSYIPNYPKLSQIIPFIVYPNHGKPQLS